MHLIIVPTCYPV